MRMGFLYLLLSIFAESTGKTIDKLNFRRTRIAARQMNLLEFFAMAVALLLFFFFVKPPLPHFALITVGLVALIALA